MVLLTVVAQKNGETVFFDEPLPQVHFMRLLSCSLYNSWDNLKKVGQIQFGTDRKVLASIPQGHYTLQSLADGLAKSLNEVNSKKIKIETHGPNSALEIDLGPSFKVGASVTRALAHLLNSGPPLSESTYVKKLNSPSAYFIHCDLIDKNQNFLNNKKTDLLAKFDVKGRPYEKVSYHASPEQPLRDCSTSSHVNSITLTVRDQDGELFDFKGFPIEFELEIN